VNCSFQCAGSPTFDCENDCKKENCAEYTAKAALPLSAASPIVYTITDDNAPASGANCSNPAVNSYCECGSDYTDNAARCNEPGATMLIHVPAFGCEVSSAIMSYSVSTWGAASTVSIHRTLRPVVAPQMGLAGFCAPSTVASWFRSGPEAWTLAGGQGDGTDRSATKVTRLLSGNTGTRTESFDVTALVGDCANGCVLQQHATPAHVNVFSGTVSWVYECSGPAAVCGDGMIGGTEQCDDGNAVTTDGCAGCAVTAGYTCSGEPSVCVTTCGDGIVAGDEACDLGPQNGPSATCSATCEIQDCTTVVTCQ
jgi:cysteine-rich repeat protein